MAKTIENQPSALGDSRRAIDPMLKMIAASTGVEATIIGVNSATPNAARAINAKIGERRPNDGVEGAPQCGQVEASVLT